MRLIEIIKYISLIPNVVKENRFKIFLFIMMFLIIVIIKLWKFKYIYATKYYVIDGDTICIWNGKHSKEPKIKIRLYGIDAPESDQEFGKESKKALEKLLKNRRLKIKVKNKDIYGRYVGIISTGTIKDVNLIMIRTGNAIFYEKYSKNEIKYKKAEEYAKKKRLGIWGIKNFVEPEKFRKGK